MLKRLSKLLNMSTITSTPETFPLFPYLPGELRTLIWKHAVDPYRVLHLVLYQKDFPPNSRLPPSSQFLGSVVYGPPWNVKVGCTDALVVATRQVRNVMRVSREPYRDITDYILPDRIHVTVDWDPPYLRGTHKYASKGERVYKIPWNRRTERVCLEMVHLKWDTHESERMREGVWARAKPEIPRGGDLPAPPVWVNEVGYEPFGQDPESDSVLDVDKSCDASRPSRFSADAIAAASALEPDPNPDPDRDLDPRAPGEIYIPHSLAQSLTRRHISLAPILTRLAPVAFRSSIPLLLLCKILRVTNVTIIADSLLNGNLLAGYPSPAWVDEHKKLHEPGMAELSRLSTALTALLETEKETHEGQQAGTPASVSPMQAQTQSHLQTQTPHQVLAHELRSMSLSPYDLAKIRFFRVREPNPPLAQDSRRNAREAQRVGEGGGEWGNGRSGISNWAGVWNGGDQSRGHDSHLGRREGQYGGSTSSRGRWAYPDEGQGRVWGPAPLDLDLDLHMGLGQGTVREAVAGGMGWESLGAMGAMGGIGGGRVLDTSPPVTSVSVGRWGSGSGSGSGFEWLV